MNETFRPITANERSLIENHPDLLVPVARIAQENGLMLVEGAPEEGMQTQRLPNGDVRVRLVYVLDNDDKASNGCIFMGDEFILEGGQLNFKGFHRFFRYHGASSRKWEQWLEKYKKETGDPAFSQKLEFTDKVIKKSLLLSAMGRPGYQYFAEAGEFVKSVDPKLTARVLEGQSKFWLTTDDASYKLNLLTVVDTDGDSGNGRIMMKDVISLEKNGGKIKSHERKFILAQASRGKRRYVQFVNQLNVKTKKTPPSRETAQGFIDAVAPDFFPGISPAAQPPVAALTPGSGANAQPVQGDTPSKSLPDLKSLKAGKTVSGPHASPAPSSGGSSTSHGKEGTFGPFRYSSGVSGKRTDRRNESVARKIVQLSRPYYERSMRQADSFALRCVLQLEINNQTGNVIGVKFSDVRTGNTPVSQVSLKQLFHQIAGRLQKGLSFAKESGRARTVLRVPMAFMPNR